MTLRIIRFIILSAAMCLIQPTTGKHVRKYDDGFCDGKLDGNYKDPDTCYGYIACSNEIAYKMPCPTGLMYNEEKDQCDYPGNVDCGKAPVKRKHVRKYDDGFCDGKLDGNYKDPDTCYGYIACSNEIAYKMPCPTGLMYNEEKDQCDYPGNVDCGKAPVKRKHVRKYDDGFCDGKLDGNYKDPDTCYGYIACSNEIAYKMPCPTGLMYNEEKDQCDYPGNVDCGKAPVKRKHVRKYDDGFCDGKLDGNYKDPDTCYGYIACSNEIAYKMPCPTGLMYNEEKDQCDYPKNVPCILRRTYGEDI